MGKYNEIMEHIELTDEMRERIIGNIGAVQKRRRISMAVRWVSAAAACVVIAVSAAAVLNRSALPKTPDESVPVTESEVSVTASSEGDDQAQQGFDVKEYSSAEELSEAFGVELNDVTELPFEVTESSYIVLFGNIAEIDHYGANGENCCIRAGKDTEDISGDYNEYDTVKETEADGVKVTLKGNGGRYYLAVWIKDGHFYSVALSDGSEEQEITDIVLDVLR
ncbi:MAG: hypothetical protein K6C68_02460 [Ruminococcus sp.]|nr:hypothetical protein [Ruminococcus sp.]